MTTTPCFPLHVHFPKSSTLTSTATTYLPLHNLPPQDTCAHVIKTMGPYIILSIHQLTLHGCISTFTSSTSTITYRDLPIITSPLHESTQLYTTPVSQQFKLILPPQPVLNVMSTLPPTHFQDKDLTIYLHKSLGSPPFSTLVTSITKRF